MIYLDNASTTNWKPKSVIKAVHNSITKYSVNPGRGAYKLSIDAGLKVLETRELICKMFGATETNGIIFTSNCTAAINTAIRGTIKPGGHIIATCFEHNSVLRTLDSVQKQCGIEYTIVLPNSNGLITAKEIEDKIKPNTYMVITIHSSNVTGATQDIHSIGAMCKKHNLIYMVDAAQSAGHIHIDMQKDNINLLTIAGHKGLYAPLNIGVLAINKVNVSPLITGGTGTHSAEIAHPNELPEALEGGTLPLTNIMGLNAGAKYVNKHFDKIQSKINRITKYLIDNLSKIKGVTLYSKYNEVGVVSFNISNLSSSDVANELWNKYKICVRAGLQCAPLTHKYHKTLDQGMVRVSIGAHNTISEANILIDAINKIRVKEI